MKINILSLLGTRQFEKLSVAIFWPSLVLVCLLPSALLISYHVPALVGGNAFAVLSKVISGHWDSIRRTLIYAVATVAGQCLLGVAAAVSVYEIRNHRLRSFFAVVFVLPYAIPSFAAVLGWKLMLGDATPVASFAARLLELPSSNIMGDKSTAFTILCVVSIWQFFPFVFFFVYGALLGVPCRKLRSAALDGLNSPQRLLTIFVPKILPILACVAILRFLFMFSKYDTAALLGANKLVEALRIIPVEIYDKIIFTTDNTAHETSMLLLALLVFITLLIALSVMIYCLFLRHVRSHPMSAWLLSLPFLNNVYWIFRIGTLTLMLGFVAVPIIYLIGGSLLPSPQLDRGISSLSLLLRGYTLENYGNTMLKAAFTTFKGPIGNSLFCIFLVATISILWSAYFGYSLTRYSNKRSRILYVLVLLAYILPPIVLIQPVSHIGKSLALPSLLIIAMGHLCFIMPFCLLLAVEYFKPIPEALHLTAINDGMRPMQTLSKIFVPRLLSELAMIAIFASIISWNDILFSRYLGSDRGSKTLVDILADYLNESSYQTEYGKIASFSVIMAIIFAMLFVMALTKVFKHAQDRSERQ